VGIGGGAPVAGRNEIKLTRCAHPVPCQCERRVLACFVYG
jgi:hypothetical protein